MKFKALPFQTSGPILRLQSNKRQFVAGAANEVLDLSGCPPSNSSKERRVKCGLVDIALSNKYLVTAETNGLLAIELCRKTKRLPPIRLSSADVQITRIKVKGSLAIVGVSRYVVKLDLDKIAEQLQLTDAGNEPLDIDASWGTMHALHADNITDLEFGFNAQNAISASEDGMICIARLDAFDPLQPDILLRGAKLYDEDKVESNEALYSFGVNVGQSIRQIFIHQDLLFALTDTNQLAGYRIGVLLEKPNAAETKDTFEVLFESNTKALDLAKVNLWKCDCSATKPDACSCDEPGIVDIVGIVKRAHRHLCVLASHSKGTSCLIEFFNVFDQKKTSPKPRFEIQAPHKYPRFHEIVEGVDSDYIRSQMLCDDLMFLGSDTGIIYKETSKKKTQKGPY